MAQTVTCSVKSADTEFLNESNSKIELKFHLEKEQVRFDQVGIIKIDSGPSQSFNGD